MSRPLPSRSKRALPALLAAIATLVACQPAPMTQLPPDKEVVLGGGKAVSGDVDHPVVESSFKVKAAQGGVFSTPDGHLKFVIPPGALSQDTTIDVGLMSTKDFKPNVDKQGRLFMPAFVFVMDMHGAMINTDQAITVTGQADERFVLSTGLLSEARFGGFNPADWGIGTDADGAYTMTMQVKGPQSSPRVPEIGSREWYLWEWGEEAGAARWEADAAEDRLHEEGVAHYTVQHSTMQCFNNTNCSSRWGNKNISSEWFTEWEEGSYSGTYGCANIVPPPCNDPGGLHGASGIGVKKVELAHCVLALLNDPATQSKFKRADGSLDMKKAGDLCLTGDTSSACSNPIPEKPDSPPPQATPDTGNVRVKWISDDGDLNNTASYPAFVRFQSKYTGTVDVPTGAGGGATMTFPEVWLPVYKTGTATDAAGKPYTYTYISHYVLDDYTISFRAYYHNGIRQVFGTSGSSSYTNVKNPYNLTITKNKPKVDLVANVTGTQNVQSLDIHTRVVTSGNAPKTTKRTNDETWTNSSPSFRITPKVHHDPQSGNLEVRQYNVRNGNASWYDVSEAYTPPAAKPPAQRVHWSEVYDGSTDANGNKRPKHPYNITFNSTITAKIFYKANDDAPAGNKVADSQLPPAPNAGETDPNKIFRWSTRPARAVDRVKFTHQVSTNAGRDTGRDRLDWTNIDLEQLAWGVNAVNGTVSAEKNVACGVPLKGTAGYKLQGNSVNVEIGADLPSVVIPVSEELAKLELVMRYRLIRKDTGTVYNKVMFLPRAVNGKITFKVPTLDPLHQAKCWRLEPDRIEDPSFEYQVFTPTNDFNYPPLDNLSRGQPATTYINLKAIWVAPKFRVR